MEGIVAHVSKKAKDGMSEFNFNKWTKIIESNNIGLLVNERYLNLPIELIP